jgi:hypothetical protein
MPHSFRCRLVLSVLALVGAPLAAAAQQRPLTTEDPEVIGAGRLMVEAGVETGRDARYPLSGLGGNRVSFPVGVSFGLGNVGELQIDTGYQWLGIDSRGDAPFADAVSADRTRTSDVLDVTVGTKVRVLSETPTRPSVGLRFATRLPNASNESGLGLDTTDFFFSLLVGKTVGPLRVVGNAGLGILGDPLVATAQKDQFVFGVSVARALTKYVDVVGEVAGRSDWSTGTPPPGLESRAELRGAVRYTRGRSRFDAGLLLGLTTASPDFGIMAGVTIVGQAGKP